MLIFLAVENIFESTILNRPLIYIWIDLMKLGWEKVGIKKYDQKILYIKQYRKMIILCC